MFGNRLVHCEYVKKCVYFMNNWWIITPPYHTNELAWLAKVPVSTVPMHDANYECFGRTKQLYKLELPQITKVNCLFTQRPENKCSIRSPDSFRRNDPRSRPVKREAQIKQFIALKVHFIHENPSSAIEWFPPCSLIKSQPPLRCTHEIVHISGNTLRAWAGMMADVWRVQCTTVDWEN